MGKYKRKNKKKQGKQSTQPKKGQELSGTSIMEHPVMDTVTKGGLLILTALAAGGAGALIGRHSLAIGIPLALYGYHKKNNYLLLAGIGVAMSNGFQSPKKATPPQGVNGFDMKLLAEEAKDRVGTYFKNFSEKLYIGTNEPTPAKGTAGLNGEEGKEKVTYFVNPYSESKELDMSAIDRVQEHIANLSGGSEAMPTEDLDGSESEREF